MQASRVADDSVRRLCPPFFFPQVLAAITLNSTNKRRLPIMKSNFPFGMALYATGRNGENGGFGCA